MAHHVNVRRFYIDVDQTDDHTVIRRVPVQKASWQAPEPVISSPTAASPATHAHRVHLSATPQRLGEMFRSVRKRQHHS
ncbi:MAG TPA: hypothetical protein VEW66_01655 [Thermomicrobiales bacterium]|nr:hypothetical protein [Thermomicrobiales bacterium]